MFFLLLHRTRVHQRADIRVIHADANGQGPCGLGELFAKRLIDRAFNENAVGTQTVLPRSGEFSLYGLCHRNVQISALEHDHRRVAAQFHHQPLHCVRRLPIEQFTHIG